MAKKMTVDQELCVGCGVCAGLCPDVFEMQDDGKAKVVSKNDCDHNEAINNCPVGAIETENI
ncbi:MAG: ferredoxin [Candidatus Pacebacteria bacterium]|nr:ferredoxin [Candidatus Paceibacterota bacterium]